MISVNMVDVNIYEVIVEGAHETTHRVHMSQEAYRTLCAAKVTHEYVLVQCFLFLLEREPNTSILKEFDVMDIPHYFPEFLAEVKGRLER